jgi:hypothetical protein
LLGGTCFAAIGGKLSNLLTSQVDDDGDLKDFIEDEEVLKMNLKG